MPRTLIALGANLGDRSEAIRRALELLTREPRVTVAAVSHLHETAPIGGPAGQGAFLNAAATLETSLSPRELMAALRRIEETLQRRRAIRWGARTIDLDLLLYGEEVVHEADLEVPHPRMAFRRFVLAPAAEIAGDMVQPTIGWTIASLLDHLETAPRYLAIAGPIGAGKSTLAEALRTDGRRVLTEQFDAARLAAFYADPAGLAWTTEIEFLRQRTRLLAHANWPTAASPADWTVSDFWFDQSLVFSRLWLPADRHAEFERLWETSRREVRAPKLTIVLDAPAAVLLRRIAQRGREYERRLDTALLERLRIGIAEQLAAAPPGPTLTLSGENPQTVVAEVRAALAAME